MEGKEIGKQNGYRVAQLEELAYGSVLKVGGREVLVSFLRYFVFAFVVFK